MITVEHRTTYRMNVTVNKEDSDIYNMLKEHFSGWEPDTAEQINNWILANLAQFVPYDKISYFGSKAFSFKAVDISENKIALLITWNVGELNVDFI